MENAFCPATALYGSVALPFVIPTRVSCHAAPDTAACAPSVRKGACSSRNPPTSTGNPGERTRISYYAAPKMTSFAAFIKESRMSFAEPIALPLSSRAQPRDLQFRGPFLEMFFSRVYPDSYCAAPTMTTCAAFLRESRMKLANATKPDRKSGVGQWRDLQFPFSAHEGLQASSVSFKGTIQISLSSHRTDLFCTSMY